MKLTKATLKRIIKEELGQISEGGVDEHGEEEAMDLLTTAVKERLKSAMQEDYHGDMGLLEMARAQKSIEKWAAGSNRDMYWLDFCYEELEGHPDAAKLDKYGSYNRRRAIGLPVRSRRE